MSTLRRRLVLTPMLIAMALLALGLPASAHAVYERISSQPCCESQCCSAEQSADAETRATDDACCPVSEPIAGQTECCAISEDCRDQDQSGVQCGARGMKHNCIPSHDCCPGARSDLGGYL
jgi:hypothetical protein